MRRNANVEKSKQNIGTKPVSKFQGESQYK